MQNRGDPSNPLSGFNPFVFVGLVGDPLEALTRELDASPSAPAEGFASVLSITTTAMRVTGRCADCCHWSLPLAAPYAGRVMPASVAMAYNEWIVWAWHVIQHQRPGCVA